MIIESLSEHNTDSDAKQREATVQETDRWHPYSTVHVVQGRELATRHMEKRTNTQTKSSVHRCSIYCRARITVHRSLPRSCVAIRKMFLKLRFPFFSSATVQISLAPTRRASLERGPDATTCAKELETHTSLDCFEPKCRKKIDYRSVARVKPQV